LSYAKIKTYSLPMNLHKNKAYTQAFIHARARTVSTLVSECKH